MKFLLIERGEIWSPTGSSNRSILIAGEKIAVVGEVDRRGLDLLKVDYEHIDANGCLIWPGLIDVHEHLIGGSGEEGWGTQTPEITLGEIVGSGITTVVGCLGTDTITRTMPALLARAKSLNAEGITAKIWSGGYDVPPVTLTGSIRKDMLLIDEVIGGGEIAIADGRSTAPSAQELARLVKDVHVGGMLTGKPGVTHFHVGEEVRRLRDLRVLLDDWGVKPEWIYPTHIERNEALVQEAAALTARGVTVDIDVIEKDLAKWLRFFLDQGGDPARLTASSDAAISSPRTLFEQVRSCVLDEKFPLELVLPLVTVNPAAVLQMSNKARIEADADADLAIVDAASLEIRHVVARGKHCVRDGTLICKERYLSQSNRKIELYGDKSW
ncbi:MAG TPA: hypothetical protein VEQ63_14815 [Bryobacteraceae bacterium]|nr:hypothetical protein [Bryobacteraceae bacterium]